MAVNGKLIPIRWRIFAFMFLIGFVAYLQQKTLTIAAAPMEPELALSQFQVGWLRFAFVLGYAVCQFPAGLIGGYLGARLTFIYAGTLAIIAMLAMPLAPQLLHGDALFVAMLAAQCLLGVAQSVVWPVSAGVIGRWFPSTRWAYVIGLQTMSLSLASAFTPPLISHLMVSHGCGPGTGATLRRNIRACRPRNWRNWTRRQPDPRRARPGCPCSHASRDCCRTATCCCSRSPTCA